jgi:hypothetical protein
MCAKNNIWLISSKDIEELNGNSTLGKRCIHSENSEVFDIYDDRYNDFNKKMSLGSFYYDLYLKYYNKISLKTDSMGRKYPFIENLDSYLATSSEEINNTDKIVIDYDEIKSAFNRIKGIKDTTEILNWNVFKLKDHNVFFTRCFPTVLNSNIDLTYAHKYWLLSYFFTVCRILEINDLKDYSFNFILHDKDIQKTGEGKYLLNDFIGNEFNSIPLDFSIEAIQLLGSRIYYYQHDDNSSLYYRNIIKNINFFDNCNDANTLLETTLNIENYIEEFRDLLNI